MQRSQYAAILIVEEIGERLVREHSEIAQWYADLSRPFTCRAIAKKIIPREFSFNPVIAQKAVNYVIKRLLPPRQRIEVTHERRSQNLKARWDFTSQKWRAHCRRAALARAEKKVPIALTALLTARGLVYWSDDELARLVFLSKDPSYKKIGRRWGRREMVRDYAKIAEALNREFHAGKPVRRQSTCAANLFVSERTMMRRRARKLPVI